MSEEDHREKMEKKLPYLPSPNHREKAAKIQSQEISQPITSVNHKALSEFKDIHHLNIKKIIKVRHVLSDHVEDYTRTLLRCLQKRHGVIKPHMFPRNQPFHEITNALDRLIKTERQYDQYKGLQQRRHKIRAQIGFFDDTSLPNSHSPGATLLAIFKETLDWKSLPDKGSLLELYKSDHFFNRGDWSLNTDYLLKDMWTKYLDASFYQLRELLPHQSYTILEDIIMDLFEIEVKTYAKYIGGERKQLHDSRTTLEKEHKETIERAWQTFKSSPKYTDRYSSYTPNNEQGVVLLFGRLHELLGFEEILRVQTRYPDCFAIRNGVAERIEFEFKSSGLLTHIKNEQVLDGDICVCWENDHNLPVETIELKSFLFK